MSVTEIRRTQYSQYTQAATLINATAKSFDFHDSPDWCLKEIKLITKLVYDEVTNGEYAVVLTHGRDGEYGHVQHILTHEIVRSVTPPEVPLFVYQKFNIKISDISREMKLAMLKKYTFQYKAIIEAHGRWIMHEAVRELTKEERSTHRVLESKCFNEPSLHFDPVASVNGHNYNTTLNGITRAV